MRKMLILASGAMTFGLATGYAWSAMTAPPPQVARAAAGKFAPLPASPEERPADLDAQWTERSADIPAPCTDGIDANGSACEPVRTN